MKEYKNQVKKARIHVFAAGDVAENMLLKSKKKHIESEQFKKLQKAYHHVFKAGMILAKLEHELNEPDEIGDLAEEEL